MNGTQLTTGVLVVLLASVMGAIIVLARGPARQWAFIVLAVCGVTALASWTRNGAFHDVYVDADPSSSTSPTRPKIHKNLPFHFHDFTHDYLGPKYFAELGYLELYDCMALGEHELAADEHRAPRISANVRDLADILIDKPVDEAIAQCRTQARSHFQKGRLSPWGFRSSPMARACLSAIFRGPRLGPAISGAWSANPTHEFLDDGLGCGGKSKQSPFA